jgi:regulator of sigma E protease
MNLLASFASVLSGAWGILLAIIILLAMVTIHEFGHYLAGKILGFQINEFAVGFGPAILKKRSKKTGELFALRVIPLGGYCAFEGEDFEEEQQPEEPFEELAQPLENQEEEVKPRGAKFNDQKPWKRIIVLVAGALMNYLLALSLLFVMFGCFGCIHSYVNVYEGKTVQTPAFDEDVIGYKDIVLSVDGKDIYLASDYVDALSGRSKGDSIEIELLRKNEEGKWTEKSFSFILQADCKFKNMTDIPGVCVALGLDGETYAFSGVTMKEGFFKTIGSSFVYSFKIGGTVLRSLGELLTGKLPISSMGGPVTTISVTAQAASGGALSFLNIAAFIGVNLAVFNLLPIPALDGSKIIFCAIEWIRKKPINRKVETIIHFVGIIFLFAFAILVDVLQFIL